MQALFCHDHRFYKSSTDTTMYSNGGLSYDVLKRYINVFGSVRVVARQERISDKADLNRLTLASGKDVEFVAIENFKSIRGLSKLHNAKSIIYNEVKNCDLVIARLPSSIGSMAVAAAKKYDKPYLVEVVGCPWDASINYGSLLGKLMAPYGFINLKRITSNSSYLIYITKSFLQKRYPSKGQYVVCPNVQISKVDIEVLENRLSKIKSRDSQIIKLGLIGSLDVKYKGHDTLIKALAYLQNPNIKVEFLGKGDSSHWYKMAKKYNVHNQIKFMGSLPSGEAVYEWIDSMDIMVQPSLAEAQGRSIIEAMSRGAPILSTKVGGIVELLDSYYLIEKSDYIDLAKKINRLLASSQNMEVAAVTNFNNAKEYYENKISATRINFLKKFMRENT